MSIEVLLSTRGFVAIVDIDDYELVSQYKWCAQKNYRTFYAQRNVKLDSGYTTQYMHTLITGFPHVDHINGNGLDNRKENLRETNNTLNRANSRKRLGCTSKYKGVNWYAATGKWRAQININHRAIHLGYFFNEEDAAKAYDRKALELFGEHAKLNFLEVTR